MSIHTIDGQNSGETSEHMPSEKQTSVNRGVEETRAVLQQATNKVETQKWLNQDQEWSYHELSRLFHEMSAFEARKWILELFQSEVMHVRGTPLQLAELASMTIQHAEGKSASKIAGTKITRPVVHFSDIGEFQRFCCAWRGPAGMSSRGMIMTLTIDDSPVPLLFACGPLNTTDEELPSNAIRIGNAEEFIEHEITHSIDPNLDRRSGYDMVLCEALAFYDSIIVNPQIPTKEPNWGFYRETLKGYFEKWSAEQPQEWNRVDYDSVCSNLVEAIRSARKTHGDIDIQRMLAKNMSVQGFIEVTRLKPTTGEIS